MQWDDGTISVGARRSADKEGVSDLSREVGALCGDVGATNLMLMHGRVESANDTSYVKLYLALLHECLTELADTQEQGEGETHLRRILNVICSAQVVYASRLESE